MDERSAWVVSDVVRGVSRVALYRRWELVAGFDCGCGCDRADKCGRLVLYLLRAETGMGESETIFSEVIADLRVLNACLRTGTRPTPGALETVWGWFLDVEIVLPIPVMPLVDTERDALAKDVVSEMLSAFESASEKWRAMQAESDEPVPALDVAAPEITLVDTLWRELAGCYAAELNQLVPEVPEETASEYYSTMVEQLSQHFEMEPAEVRQHVASDSAFRMSLRRQGLDPDRIQ